MTQSPSLAAADNNSLFSVVSGSMRGIVSDAGDPQLIAMARMAARQLMNTTQEDKQVGGRGGWEGGRNEGWEGEGKEGWVGMSASS